MSQAPFARRDDTAARIRPMAGAALFGVTVGLAVGLAYLAGSTARGATVRAHAQRLGAAHAAGFTEEALSAAAGGLNESALAIARRHDPYAVSGPSRRDRQAELMTARLERVSFDTAAPGLRAPTSTGPAIRPFRLDSALDASRDLECLTQAVYYEARGEGRDGMRAVAQVVLNRARHAAFPKTVCGVVFQGANRRTGCQFSFTCDGSMRGRVNNAAWNRARDVAAAALDGAVYAPVGASTHFHTTAVAPRWRGSLIRVTQVGDHVFYRFGGRAGASHAFSQTPEASGALLGADMIEASYDPTMLPEAEAPVALTAVPVAQPAQSAPQGAQQAAPQTTPHLPAPQAAPQPAPRTAPTAALRAPRDEPVAPAA